jgi:ribonuclease HI
MDPINVWCDGSSNNKGQFSLASWKAVIEVDADITEKITGTGFGTSDEAELKAVIIALDWIYKCNLFGELYYIVNIDSKQVYNILTKKWIAYNGRIQLLVNVINDLLDLIPYIVKLEIIRSKNNKAHCSWAFDVIPPPIFSGIETIVDNVSTMVKIKEHDNEVENGLDPYHDINEWEGKS